MDPLDSLTEGQVSQLVDYYIDYIHDKPHSLFHTPTLRRDVAQGSIDKTLLCAILGLVARFSPENDIRALGPRLASQAQHVLQSNLGAMSLESIQSWILLGNIVSADCDYACESRFFGIATRTAHIIGLAKPIPNETAISAETRLRTWLSLYMIDRWSSAGLGTPRQMSDRPASQGLPRMEFLFHGMQPEQELWPVEPSGAGLWAHMITLVEIFGPIQDLNRLLATGTVDEAFIVSAVSSLSGRLDDWERQLPIDVRLNASNLELHQSRGQARTFVALHLGYYHYGSLLYFQYLDASASALPYAAIYAERCREHASAFSDLLRTSYDKGCEAMYNIVAHMAVVSSSVLIHTLLLGDEAQIDPAKARLESNFKILMRLRQWWPSVDSTTQKLFSFQKACLRSADNHTHKIDRWMVKFLLEHGNAIGDKTVETAFDTPSPYGGTGDSPQAQQIMARDRLTRQALSELRASSVYAAQTFSAM
ncbi:hypothetical protein LTR17_008963 [Elasticomyces elasticus]|nr:hypothetical protein LTR17_008963 [Elasticomyces elasticus]